MANIEEFKNQYSIPVGCKELEEIEDKKLAPWATKYSEIKYKKEDESQEETYRTRFRRDKDRILYSKGFRRLQYKTQVIGTNAGDDFRTRLTHSLEVEQIATSLADALKLNKDLVSAIALGHDLGHTPYGHAVESLLNKHEKLEGFSHAVQSVRYLENQVKDRNGLNISVQVLEGILKHDTDIYDDSYDGKQYDCSHLKPHLPGSLESQVVYWADKIAYLSHDFEDFDRTRILHNAMEANHITQEQLDKIFSILITEKKSERATRDILRNVIKNLIDGTIVNLAEMDPKSADEVVNITTRRMEEQKSLGASNKAAYRNALLVNFSDEYRQAFLELREIMAEHYVGSPEVKRSDATAKRSVGLIVEEFLTDHKLLPLRIQKYIDGSIDSKERAIADYIASMTDRQARSMYNKLFEIGDYNQYE